MNESVRDLLRQSADTVQRPNLDVGDLVAQADRRMRRRRLVAGAASAVAVAVIVAGAAVALRPDESRPTPAPPVPTETPRTPEPAPAYGTTVYFTALSSGGDALTVPTGGIEGDMDLYVARSGEPVRRIVASKKVDECPRVSPDGTRLAFIQGREVVVRRLNPAGDLLETELRVDLGDRAARERRDSPPHPACLEWSPDGRSLGVLAGGNLRMVGLDGSDRVLASDSPGSQAWSARGDAISYTTDDGVWSVPVDGGARERVWEGNLGSVIPGTFSMSSTGEFAFGEGPETTIHVVDPRSQRDQVIGAFRGEAPSWSPDGSRLAVAGADGLVRVHDRSSGPTVTRQPQLAGVPSLRIWDVSWSPDGERLLGAAFRDPDPSSGPYAFVSMAPDGTDVELLTPWTSALYWTGTDEASWRP